MYPSTADYVQLLIDLAAQAEPNDFILAQAIAVLRHWAQLIGNTRMPLPDVTYLQHALHEQAVLPTHKGEWVSLADELVIRDDAGLAQAFSVSKAAQSS